MKKRNRISIALLTCLLLGACSTTATSQTAATKEDAILENEEAQNPLLDEEDAKNDKNTTMQDNLDGMEFDAQDEVTLEALMQQLTADGIVSGAPQELKDGVKEALHTTQIGSVIIVEYDAKNPAEFLKAYDAKRITLQGKEYPIIATNAQFALLLLDEQDKEKAAASFQRRKNDDGRLIIF